MNKKDIIVIVATSLSLIFSSISMTLSIGQALGNNILEARIEELETISLKTLEWFGLQNEINNEVYKLLK